MKIHVYIIWHWVTQKVYISDICICKRCYVKWVRRRRILKKYTTQSLIGIPFLMQHKILTNDLIGSKIET